MNVLIHLIFVAITAVNMTVSPGLLTIGAFVVCCVLLGRAVGRSAHTESGGR